MQRKTSITSGDKQSDNNDIAVVVKDYGDRQVVTLTNENYEEAALESSGHQDRLSIPTINYSSLNKNRPQIGSV